MADAVQRYHEHRRSAEAWALGSFVLPVARLGEFDAVATQVPVAAGAERWPLALTAGADFGADVATIAEFAERAARRVQIAAIEVKAGTVAEVGAIAAHVALLRATLPAPFAVYVEVPIASDPAALVDAIAFHGLRAKVRTGGVEARAFPTAPQLSAFFSACSARGVMFKATAGLHHAIRGSYPLTYAPASERGTMFGFLNVFLAALFERDGLGPADTRALLEERDPGALAITASGVSWRGHTVPAEALHRFRAQAAASFGSCSFAEPVADLAALGLL